ncbi:class I SAM-dependent methyltransferase [Thaumasiovibrio subtropicus]|uniref:class I SAM-dependent methyltransferase n=1 Tax=Thaumasiovibrio subtropicus TaxID=1891207 RepID=UPI000B356BB7|nr:class I SAM-dependent methyltransferase [Thaumasiovibrio subtropicus]
MKREIKAVATQSPPRCGEQNQGRPVEGRDARSSRYKIPAKLIAPLWLRSRESLVDNAVIYDPMAASACRRCELASECLDGNVNGRQLLHATLTKLTDQRVAQFLTEHPKGWVINIGAGLDTRFYRLDNGLCRWLELENSETLVWRQRLFHRNERYYTQPIDISSPDWPSTISVPNDAPVLVLIDQALLQMDKLQIAALMAQLGRHFDHGEAALVVAGDWCHTRLGKTLGCESYQHGFNKPGQQLLQMLPWASLVDVASPLSVDCSRWQPWRRWLAMRCKHRITPVMVHLRW